MITLSIGCDCSSCRVHLFEVQPETTEIGKISHNRIYFCRWFAVGSFGLWVCEVWEQVVSHGTLRSICLLLFQCLLILLGINENNDHILCVPDHDKWKDCELNKLKYTARGCPGKSEFIENVGGSCAFHLIRNKYFYKNGGFIILCSTQGT